MADLERLRQIINNIRSRPGMYGDRYLQHICDLPYEKQSVIIPKEIDFLLDGIDKEFLRSCGIEV